MTESLRIKEKNYSLLWLLDNTKTAMGGRKLRQWIETPLKDKKIIETEVYVKKDKNKKENLLKRIIKFLKKLFK